MQPPIFAKYNSARTFTPLTSEKHDTDIPHFKLLKKINKNLKNKHTGIILEQYFPSFVKICIILLPLFLGYDMSCVVCLSVTHVLWLNGTS